MSFRIEKTNNSTLLDNINFNVIPQYTRHNHLDIGDLKLSILGSVNGWLVCDGSNVSIEDYPELYAIIGTSFGGGEGTFNLPDFTSRVVGMFGESAQDSPLTVRNMGESIGEETHTLTIPEMPTHLHTGTTDIAGAHIHAITDPGHTHSYVNTPYTANPAVSLTTMDVASNSQVGQTTGTSTTGITINSSGNHTHTFTSNNTGGSNQHNIIQPTLFGCKVLIFAKWIPKTSMEQVQYTY